MEIRDFRPLEKRYDQEEPIRNIVDTLTSLLIDKQLTPQELGDVVAMAQIKYCSVLVTLGDAGLLSTEATDATDE